jgi:hypothetical protein
VSATVDAGRAAAYAAEDRAFGGTDLDVPEDVDELVAFAASITSTDWWRSAGGPSVAVESARTDARSSSARGDGDAVVIRLAASHRTRATLGHELAHALAGVDHGHDATFRAAHVDVVAMIAGAAAAHALTSAYADLGVPCGRRRWPPPIRVTGDGFVVLP